MKKHILKPVHKQLFMNIYDITPTEPLWEVIDDKLEPKETWFKEDLIDSIRKEGFRYQLNVDPNGYIRNGNARYWVARMLLETEHDERFRFLPIQRHFATGFYHLPFKLEFAKDIVESSTKEEIQQMYDETMNKLTREMFSDFQKFKQLTIPSQTEFKEYTQNEGDPIFLTTHYERTTGDYVSFYTPHPDRPEEMMFICILEGHRSFAEAQKDERLKDHFDQVISKQPETFADFTHQQELLLAKREKK